METPKQKAFIKQAETIIKNLEKRNMEGYYCENSADCIRQILELIPSGSTIAWGGSQSVSECGLMDAIHNGSYQLIDRNTAKTDQEKRDIYAKTVMADYYLMSTNAITFDGELLNIDGNGNRVACLITGPSNVICVVGRNKVSLDMNHAMARARNIAAPINVQRLNRQTPCLTTGCCANCNSPESICNQFVITRRSGAKGRIKIFLVNEDLGY